MAESDAESAGLIKHPGYLADMVQVTAPLHHRFMLLKPTDNIMAQMMLQEQYELAFGIQTTKDASPISLVTHSEATDIYTDCLLEKTITKLIKYKVPELTGMSLQQLLDLPTFQLKTIMRSVRTVRKLEALPTAELNALKKSLKEF